MAKFIKTFTEHKKLDNYILLGNSLGGHIALLYVLAHPENIGAVILTGSSGLFESAFGSSFQKRGNYEFIKEHVESTFYEAKTASKEGISSIKVS